MASVSEYIGPLQKIIPNPAVAALVTGGLLYGGTKLVYPWMSGAAKHVARRVGISSPEELDEIEHNINKPSTRTWLPAIVAALGAGGVLASTYRSSEHLPMGGWFVTWNDKRRTMPPKKGSLKKTANDLFNWEIADQTSMDFHKMIPVRMAKDIVMNDPNTEVYQKGNALSIINNASGGMDNGRMSAGSLFDSALNKVQQNLTLGGITDATVRGVIGYGVAKAFTNTMSTMVDMPKKVRDGIVSLGMISNVIQGLD